MYNCAICCDFVICFTFDTNRFVVLLIYCVVYLFNIHVKGIILDMRSITIIQQDAVQDGFEPAPTVRKVS